MSEDSIPKEYEGGEKLLVTIAEKDQNNKEISEETQQKQLKEAIKKAEESGGYIYSKSSLYPGFSVIFKPGSVHALDSVEHVSTESADGQVTTQ